MPNTQHHSQLFCLSLICMLCGDFQGAEGAEVMTNYTFNDTQWLVINIIRSMHELRIICLSKPAWSMHLGFGLVIYFAS